MEICEVGRGQIIISAHVDWEGRGLNCKVRVRYITPVVIGGQTWVNLISEMTRGDEGWKFVPFQYTVYEAPWVRNACMYHEKVKVKMQYFFRELRIKFRNLRSSLQMFSWKRQFVQYRNMPSYPTVFISIRLSYRIFCLLQVFWSLIRTSSQEWTTPSSFKTPGFLLSCSEGVVKAQYIDRDIRNQFTHGGASGRDR
jgi:hypothetical protein